MLAEAGWTDTNGDGTVDKDGKELKLRYFDRSEGDGGQNTDFLTGWLKDIGIATEVTTMDDDALTAAIGQNEFDIFTWGWVPFVDPDAELSYFTSDQATTDPEVVGYNDANWCSDKYDELYAQQHVELDIAKRRDIVQQMLEIMYEEAPYVVLYKYDDLQAIRSDRWENFVRQPAEDRSGAVHQHVAGVRRTGSQGRRRRRQWWVRRTLGGHRSRRGGHHRRWAVAAFTPQGKRRRARISREPPPARQEADRRLRATGDGVGLQLLPVSRRRS